MVVAPGAGDVEIAGPDAAVSLAGGRLLGPVAAGGDSETFGHHDGAEIAAVYAAGGEKAAILIGIFGAAIGRAGGEELGHAVAGRTAARPGFPVIGGTVLRQLGSVEAEQADAIPAETETVAIAHAAKARHGRRRPIERRRDECEGGQDHERENGPARTAKDGIAPASSLQDFTTR